MKELVGTCNICGKKVYCEDGFLNGVHEKNKLYCNNCYSKKD